MLDLKELERKVDEMIANDTPEEMEKWLRNKLAEETNENNLTLLSVAGIKDFEEKYNIAKANPHWTCRHHPTNWWHEVGCPHQKWTVEQLQYALEGERAVNRIYQHEHFGLPLDGNPIVSQVDMEALKKIDERLSEG